MLRRLLLCSWVLGVLLLVLLESPARAGGTLPVVPVAPAVDAGEDGGATQVRRKYRAADDEDEEEEEDDDDRPRRKKKAKHQDDDDDDSGDVEEVPMATKAVVLPFMMLVGLAPCCFPLSGILIPFAQWRYVVGRPGFNNPLRGLAIGYAAFGGMVAASCAYCVVCGGLSAAPGLLLSVAMGDSSLGSSCMGLGLGFTWLVGVLATAAFWVVLEPLLVWYASQ